jgi:hypothetical protein
MNGRLFGSNPKYWEISGQYFGKFHFFLPIRKAEIPIKVNPAAAT